MSELVDSGVRTTFDGGAQREIVEGKGRCDLLPLDVVAHYMSANGILFSINDYVKTGNTEYLYVALGLFVEQMSWDKSTAMIELSKQYEDGAKKYADRNWEKGLPLHSFIDSATRHYLKVLRGDKDEPHDRAFMWNIFGAIWTHTHHPECIDLPFNMTTENIYGNDKLIASVDSPKIINSGTIPEESRQAPYYEDFVGFDASTKVKSGTTFAKMAHDVAENLRSKEKIEDHYNRAIHG